MDDWYGGMGFIIEVVPLSVNCGLLCADQTLEEKYMVENDRPGR